MKQTKNLAALLSQGERDWGSRRLWPLFVLWVSVYGRNGFGGDFSGHMRLVNTLT